MADHYGVVTPAPAALRAIPRETHGSMSPRRTRTSASRNRGGAIVRHCVSQFATSCPVVVRSGRREPLVEPVAEPVRDRAEPVAELETRAHAIRGCKVDQATSETGLARPGHRRRQEGCADSLASCGGRRVGVDQIDGPVGTIIRDRYHGGGWKLCMASGWPASEAIQCAHAGSSSIWLLERSLLWHSLRKIRPPHRRGGQELGGGPR